jgi:hypothetical protein
MAIVSTSHSLALTIAVMVSFAMWWLVANVLGTWLILTPWRTTVLSIAMGATLTSTVWLTLPLSMTAGTPDLVPAGVAMLVAVAMTYRSTKPNRVTR